MNILEIQTFSYNSSKIRLLFRNNEPWWILSDVCDILGISNPWNVATRLDPDEKGLHQVDTLGGLQSTTIINESGLYSVILRSDKPEAKAFRRWITHEILPQIRKTGTYGIQQLSRKELALMVLEAEEALEQAQRVIKEQAPKVELADQCLTAVNSLSITEAAKILETGRTRLFKLLREKNVLMRSNNPYQEFIDRGYFEVKAHPIKMGDVTINYPQTYVTGRGLDYIRKLIGGNHD